MTLSGGSSVVILDLSYVSISALEESIEDMLDLYREVLLGCLASIQTCWISFGFDTFEWRIKYYDKFEV